VRLLRVVTAWTLITGAAASAAAGDLRASVVKAVERQEQATKPLDGAVSNAEGVSLVGAPLRGMVGNERL
jgi:hypothetical protein